MKVSTKGMEKQTKSGLPSMPLFPLSSVAVLFCFAIIGDTKSLFLVANDMFIVTFSFLVFKPYFE